MRYMHTFLIATAILLVPCISNAQYTGTIGQWRDHFSYVNVRTLVEGGSSIYCASSTGAFRYDRNSGELDRLTKVNALSDVGINGLAWHEGLQMLLVYYSNGNLDLIQGNNSHNMSDIKRSSLLGNKTINDVQFQGDLAYLSCGFGIVVVDLARREVRDTWFIGPGGGQVVVNQMAFTADSIYAATNSGLIVASRNATNLASFENWHRREDMGPGVAEGPMNAVLLFQEKLLVNYKSNTESDTLLVLENGEWWRATGLYQRKNNAFRVSPDGQYVILTHPGDIQQLNGALDEVSYVFGYAPQYAPKLAILGTDGLFWLADAENGLVRSTGFDNGQIIVPNGPRSSTVLRMDMEGGNLFVATGAVGGNWSNTYSKDGVHTYANGEWRTFNPNNSSVFQGVNEYGGTVNDIMTVVVDPKDPNRAFAGSWDEGLIEFRNREPYKIHNSTNSSLGPPVSGAADAVNVAGLDFDDKGNLWITNAHATTPIAVLTPNDDWYSYDPGSVLGGNYLVSDILAASNGYKWVIRPRGSALLVFDDNGTLDDASDDRSKVMKNQPGEGNLPSQDVYSVAEDLDGEIWVGTNKGVAVFYNPSAIFSGNDFDAQQILIEQDGNVQVLFETEAVSAIAVDGADRKWVGTQSSGVFLVSPDGREQIHHFTAENSPMPSNTITSITLDKNTGDVYFGTDRGIISYRSDAIGGENEASCASVFPNPVRETHTGPIAITGLLRDSEVKITDVSGNLVYRTTSLGGQAIWTGENMSGNRVSTGVYLIFASDRTGTYKCNTKVLVVR